MSEFEFSVHTGLLRGSVRWNVFHHQLARRFPPPWSVEDIGAAFVVIDSAGHKLAYVYFDRFTPNIKSADRRVTGLARPR
jgi:hypothetical protein